MFRVIYMMADYEPWWQFDEWEQAIQQESVHTTIQEAEAALAVLLEKFRANYPNELVKDDMYAFWKEGEIVYCEACEDDGQIYHGLFIQKID